MAHAWKACWVRALGGSNPPSSAGRRARDLQTCRSRALRGFAAPAPNQPAVAVLVAVRPRAAWWSAAGGVRARLSGALRPVVSGAVPQQVRHAPVRLLDQL